MGTSRKISVYVSDDLHRALKSAASLRGISLSEFMIDAAKQVLHAPSRKESAAKMDMLRETSKHVYARDEIREMREEGRRGWQKQ